MVMYRDIWKAGFFSATTNPCWCHSSRKSLGDKRKKKSEWKVWKMIENSIKSCQTPSVRCLTASSICQGRLSIKIAQEAVTGNIVQEMAFCRKIIRNPEVNLQLCLVFGPSSRWTAKRGQMEQPKDKQKWDYLCAVLPNVSHSFLFTHLNLTLTSEMIRSMWTVYGIIVSLSRNIQVPNAYFADETTFILKFTLFGLLTRDFCGDLQMNIGYPRTPFRDGNSTTITSKHFG